jgi:hypothetical protein
MICILISAIARWIIKRVNHKINSAAKNLTAVLVSSSVSVFIDIDNFIIYFLMAIPTYYMYQYLDKKAANHRKIRK